MPWCRRAQLKYVTYSVRIRRRCAALITRMWSRHSRHTLPSKRSQIALARGAHAAVQDHRKRKHFLSWSHADSQSGAWLLGAYHRSLAAPAASDSVVNTHCKPLIRSDRYASQTLHSTISCQLSITQRNPDASTHARAARTRNEERKDGYRLNPVDRIPTRLW